MTRKSQAVVFYVIAIAVLALAAIIVIVMLHNPGSIDSKHPPCMGDCRQHCEWDEEPTISSDCPYLKPICCILFEDTHS